MFIRGLIPFQYIQQRRSFHLDINNALTAALQLSDLLIQKIIVLFAGERNFFTACDSYVHYLRSGTEITQVLRSVDCSNASAADKQRRVRRVFQLRRGCATSEKS